MLKVVVADDEARVCKLVLMLADWESLGMEVAGTAANGLEALEQVKTHRPDILITDIRMPGLHGLALIEQAKAVLPTLEIVIISGYAHFEYAQTAIKQGVGDYLLKPIQRLELMDTLEKLGARCRARQALAQGARPQPPSCEDLDRLWTRLMDDIWEGRLATPTAEILRAEYQCEVGPGLFQAVLLKLDYPPEAFSPASLAIVREKAEKIFGAALPGLCQRLLFTFRAPWGCWLLNCAPKSREAVRRVLRDCLNQLTAQQPLFGPIEFTLALGQSGDGPEFWPQSLGAARDAMGQRLVEGTGRLLEGRTRPSAQGVGNLLERYGRAIEHALETRSPAEAGTAVDLLVSGQTEDLRGRELLELVSSAGHLFVLRLGMEDREEVLRDFDLRLGQCGRGPELFQCLRALQETQLGRAEERQQSEAIRPIRMAKQYVQQHFGENLTLEDVCAAIGFSVSYFSVLFKRETGEGFAKYLTRVRMDRAKELLQDTTLPVAEICAQVGYSDLRYFTQTFKKVTSLNPGQYRKLYG